MIIWVSDSLVKIKGGVYMTKKLLAVLTVVVFMLVIAPNTFADSTYLPTKANVSITPKTEQSRVQLDVPKGKVALIFADYIYQEDQLIVGTIIPVNPGRYVFDFPTRNVTILYPEDSSLADFLRKLFSTKPDEQSAILFFDSEEFANFIITDDSLERIHIKSNLSS